MSVTFIVQEQDGVQEPLGSGGVEDERSAGTPKRHASLAARAPESLRCDGGPPRDRRFGFDSAEFHELEALRVQQELCRGGQINESSRLAIKCRNKREDTKKN